MPRIELSTRISAPIERVFDLSRSIDAHITSASQSKERAVAGVTSGLIGANDEVTWQAKHFGMNHTLTVRITAFHRPTHFQDVMVRGTFKRMSHDHFFEISGEGTVMKDVFDFESPLGPFGRLIDTVFLERYMRNFLTERNSVLKRIAESDEWVRFLKNEERSL